MHWTNQTERASRWGIALLVAVMKLTGPGLIKLLSVPIAGYYFLFSATARRASVKYFSHLKAARKAAGLPANSFKGPLLWMAFRHFVSFAMSLIDRFYSWHAGAGQLQYETQNEDLIEEILIKDTQGALILVSHIGNFDLAIARGNTEGFNKKAFNIVMNKRYTQIYNQFRSDMFRSENMRYIDPEEIDSAEIISLAEGVAKGEAVVMAADRTVAANRKNNVVVNFLGQPAEFPSAPYIIARMLKVPVYCLFAFKKGNKCVVKFELFDEKIAFPRHHRKSATEKYAQRFAARIEKECFEFPFQWYNFYNFWDLSESQSYVAKNLPSEELS